MFAGLPLVLLNLDDIIVFSESAEEHAAHLRQVLALLREHKLFAKMSKCFFFRDSVDFLGHVVSAQGVKVDIQTGSLRTCCFTNPAQNNWDVRLPCCEFAVNNAWNKAAGSTPFSPHSGHHPRSPVNMNVVTPLPAANTL